MFRSFLIVVLMCCLGACHDKPASYAYQQPITPGGRMCTDQCSKSRDYCAQACSLDYRACINDMQAMGQQSFDYYASERFAIHLPMDKKPSDFERPETCLSERSRCMGDCDTPYRSCYNRCGGVVTPVSLCSFLCF